MSNIDELSGTWDVRTNRSADIGRFSKLVVSLTTTGKTLKITREWGAGGYSHRDERTLVIDGGEHADKITDSVVAESAMMNLRMRAGEIGRAHV